MEFVKNNSNKRIFIVLLAFLVFINSCNRKKNFVNTNEIKKGLYNEMYNPINGGAFGGESYTYFLTDSLYFRKYIGKCDEKEQYLFKLQNNVLNCSKISFRNNYGNGFKIIDSFRLNIIKLKANGVFE